jgi:hypothetical protein
MLAWDLAIMTDFLLRVLNHWAAAPAGSGEKKPPGAGGFLGSLRCFYARLPLQPPKWGENQKYAKKRAMANMGGECSTQSLARR